jgi:hypothetical protein
MSYWINHHVQHYHMILYYVQCWTLLNSQITAFLHPKLKIDGYWIACFYLGDRGRGGRDCAVVGNTTTCTVSVHGEVYSIAHVCQWLGRWFSRGTPVFSINKIVHHDITEILLKVAFITPQSITPQLGDRLHK